MNIVKYCTVSLPKVQQDQKCNAKHCQPEGEHLLQVAMQPCVWEYLTLEVSNCLTPLHYQPHKYILALYPGSSSLRAITYA